LLEFKDVLDDKPGKTEVVRIAIKVGDSPPINQALYKLPGIIRDRVKEEVDGLEKSEIIGRSCSSWSSPVVPVRKPDGSVSLCVDYRKLNSITVLDPWYMPTLDEVLEEIGGSGADPGG